MSANGWTVAKDRTGADGKRLRVYARGFDGAGKAREFRRVSERSRAGSKPGRFGMQIVWVAVEYCERLPDGTFSPWVQRWSHRT